MSASEKPVHVEPVPVFEASPASHSGSQSGDVKFVNTMTTAGLLTEMSVDELEVAVLEQHSNEAAIRYLDILEHYYAANGDANVGLRRRMTDRFFMHRSEDPATAKQLLIRLALLTPELGPVSLDRIGEGDEAAYVLRSGEHAGGIVDDDQDEPTDRTGVGGTISVRGLVRAMNALLELGKHRYRFVPLMRDDSREAYVATTITGALNLCQADYLEESDVESLIDFASW